MLRTRFLSSMAGVAVVLSLFMTACYEYHDETYLDELDLTATYYDTTFNFQAQNTFAIRDSVALITDNLTAVEKAAFYAPGGGSSQIKELVRTNLVNLGYSEVADDEAYDFGVNLAVMAIENTAYYYPGWWYGYYDYYYWYYPGGWYPYYGYGWGYYSYSYTSGTLLMEFADGNSIRAYREWADGKTQWEIENADPSEVPNVHFTWQSIVNGVAGTTESYNKDRVERGINEAFSQSPYLIKN